MLRSKLVQGLGLVAVAAIALVGSVAMADERQVLRIAVGRAEVVTSTDDVRTVAIAEPKIADAAVGSARTVVVNAKAPGRTSLVVYTEGARYTVYDIEVFTPNYDKQVLLHVRVAEVNDAARKQLGFDLVAAGSSLNPKLDGSIEGGAFTDKNAGPGIPLVPGGSTDGIVTYVRTANDLALQAAWRLLEEKGDLRVLANPNLLARSGEQANFLAGGEFPVPIARSVTADGAQTITIEWKEFGVKLDFKPTVEEDNVVSLHVAPEVSALDFSNPLQLSGFTVPTVIVRRSSTHVRLANRQHLIIGGLKQTDRIKVVRRVPILGAIPIIGFFFSSTRTENLDRELLIVVSPEIVDGGSATMPALPTDGTLEQK